jgi:hypothetical protein
VSDANVLNFPGRPVEHPERAQIAALVAAFDGLPDAHQVAAVNMLLERLHPSHARAAAAMLAQQYSQLSPPE